MFYVQIKCSITDQAVSADTNFSFICKRQCSSYNRSWKSGGV